MTIIFLLLYNSVRVYSPLLCAPLIVIDLDGKPISARMSPCDKYFYIHFQESGIQIYDTKSGSILQVIVEVSRAIKTIKFAANSQKLIFGSTQKICLWSLRKSIMEVETEFWKNISCYDLNRDGTSFVLGTYEGTLFLLSVLQQGRCSQMQIKKHQKSLVCVCWHEEKIISVSQDGLFLISTVKQDNIEGKMIEYRQMKIKTIPKEIQSIGHNFQMFNCSGVTWFTYESGITLTGFADFKNNKPFVNQDGQTIFVIIEAGELQWWRLETIKAISQPQKFGKKKNSPCEKQNNLHQLVKRNSLSKPQTEKRRISILGNSSRIKLLN